MNLYVSNLGYGFRDEELTQLFAAYGQVSSAKIIKDRSTGKSKGFAFVEMPDNAEAEKAMQELDGKMIDGRPVKVVEARPREEKRSPGDNSFPGRW